MSNQVIKDHFNAANLIVLSEMYLKEFCNVSQSLNEYNLKEYNPGHLGCSLSINFILSNLYYFLNENNIKSQIVIGTGHAGASLLSNLWLNGTLEKYNNSYKRNKEGLNQLIKDFGTEIRTEINPEYPETIYDGGELGYSLGVAYGYAINSDTDLVPCIIGDGEAETGTLMSSWQLAKILKTKSKVLPIINLNGLKMGSRSYLSTMSNDDLRSYFTVLGYQVQIVDSIGNTVDKTIETMQKSLNAIKEQRNPLIIFKSPKGYTLPSIKNYHYEGTINVHKNPLLGLQKEEKLEILKKFFESYKTDLFDKNENLIQKFNYFEILSPNNQKKIIEPKQYLVNSTKTLDEYIYKLLGDTNKCIFSPDEIFSNKFQKCNNLTIEILNENLLQALYQGYTEAGNFGFYISYEGFMPILSSMITQRYKYLKQKSLIGYQEKKYSMNYILTSTCWENTYSHQNPDFVNSLLEKKDDFYNVIYPKDINNAICYINEIINTNDKINIITISKRHTREYQIENKYNNKDIEVIKECSNPELILCATGDYMLDNILEIYQRLINNHHDIKIIYIAKPQILNVENKDSLSLEQFYNFFNLGVPVIYMFSGYSSIIKSLLFNRDIDVKIFGYDDEISIFGNLSNNIKNNGLDLDSMLKICEETIVSKKYQKKLVLRR